MRKHIKNSSKRKWVVGGVAFFGAVALLTTGFASWVVGASRDFAGDITVTMDDVESAEYFVDAVLNDATIRLDEDNTYDGIQNKKVITDDDTHDGDLTITFTSLSVSIRTDVLANYDYLAFSMMTGADGDVAMPTTSTSTFTGNDAREGDGPWTYVDAPANILKASWGEGVAKDGYTTYTFTGEGLTYKFSWGSFFGNVSPCHFYNEVTDPTSAQIRAASAEMEAFETAMATVVTNGISLTLTAHKTA